jgi:hypothetical protein
MYRRDQNGDVLTHDIPVTAAHSGIKKTQLEKWHEVFRWVSKINLLLNSINHEKSIFDSMWYNDVRYCHNGSIQPTAGHRSQFVWTEQRDKKWSVFVAGSVWSIWNIRAK